MMNEVITLAAFIGIDWADTEHTVCLRIPGSSEMETLVLSQEPEALAEWAVGLKARFGDRPVGLCLEQSRGALIYALSQYPWLVLYPINPKSLAKYRESLYPSRAKSDPADAVLLCEFLIKHQDRLRPWRAEDADTRQLRLLLENRETLVDDRTRLSNRLRDALKLYFPQVLEWGGPLTKPMSWDFLLKWNTLPEIQKVNKKKLLNFFYAHQVRRGDQINGLYERVQSAQALVTDRALVDPSVIMVRSLCRQLQAIQASIDQYDREIETRYARHPEKGLFEHLPGAGKVIGPRLVAAFGRDRQKYEDAGEIQKMSGMAPVVEASGKSAWTHWRWAAPAFLRQTFHEFAAHSIPRCAWAKAFYDLQRQRGKGHHAAVRSLAFKWIRILYRCWKNNVPYDENRYVQQLHVHGSPLLKFLTQIPLEA
jgi:transposase